jgi:large repetitive protein
VAVGEFNHDGDPDLAVANRDSNDVSVLLGGAGATFSGPDQFQAGELATAVAVGEFNGDGDPDLAVVNSADDTVSVLLGSDGGSFSGPTDFNVGSSPRSVAVGDFDGDGDLDLAVSNALDADVSVLLGEGDGSFTARGSLRRRHRSSLGGGRQVRRGRRPRPGDRQPALERRVRTAWGSRR